MSALPQYAPFEISKAVSAHAIALGFTKNTDGNFEFVSPLASQIEKFFGLNLVDELTFFTPTGKAGELFEIPVVTKAVRQRVQQEQLSVAKYAERTQQYFQHVLFQRLSLLQFLFHWELGSGI